MHIKNNAKFLGTLVEGPKRRVVDQRALDFMNSNEKLVQTVLDSKMLPAVMNILSRQITLDITQKLKEDAQNGVSLPASPQVMAQFFTGALVYTIKWWVTQKRVSENKLMEELTSLLRAS